MTGADSELMDAVDRLCQQATDVAGGRVRPQVESVRARLHGPLRVAIAGRVKAGKSTLLNALVGERLAPTDAGECTRVVTWYRSGLGYQVDAVLRDGTRREVPFRREDGALVVELPEQAFDEVDALDVQWPSGRLARTTLIDTPGLASIDEERSQRTRVLLGLEDGGDSQVDAVIYLMRHLHRTDVAFLDAFLDRTLARPSPVNAVAVLSRADEIGAGRLDAMASATAIAERYAADVRVRSLCATVVPVAGLIAETGATLREQEAAWLRELAAMDADERASMLLSVQRFAAPGLSPLTAEVRRDLLLRLGLFGVRFCLDELVSGRAATATDLARALTAASGVRTLTAILEGHLERRASALKARSALATLRTVASAVADADPAGSRALAGAVEQVEAGAHELAMLRLLHLVMTGTIELSDAERTEVDLLASSDAEPAVRLGLTPDTAPQQQRTRALERLEAWRTRAAHPLTDRATADACEIMAAAHERLYARLTDPSA